MAKGNAIVMYLEQARIHGEPIGVTHSEVLFTKPNGYTVQPHNRVVSKADNKTMGESFLNELIYVLGAEDGEERKLPYDREVLVYTSDEINSDNYRTYINAVNTGINCPVHNFKLCQKLRRLCDERGYHLFFSNNSLLGSTIRNDAMAELYSQLKILNERLQVRVLLPPVWVCRTPSLPAMQALRCTTSLAT